MLMIVISYGINALKSTYDALSASDIDFYIKSGFKAAIKPNLVVPGPASLGATTHPEVVEGIILYLKDFGIKDIKIIESSWVGDSTLRAFKHCGYEELSARYDIPLIDLKTDPYKSYSFDGYEIKICNEAMDTDFLINVPVLKAHCQTRLTCCMKNLKGCIPDPEKRRFHTLGIHKPVAALSALIKTGYNVVDGICGDLSFEEGGNPVTANRIIAGRDPLMIDSLCAGLIGYRPEEIEYISHGLKAGVGRLYTADTPVIELNTENKPVHNAGSSRAAERYAGLIDEDSACSACYSALIYALHRLGGKPRGTQLSGGLYIGQGFKGKTGTGTGIGSCAKGFSKCVAGCPPKAIDIINALK